MLGNFFMTSLTVLSDKKCIHYLIVYVNYSNTYRTGPTNAITAIGVHDMSAGEYHEICCFLTSRREGIQTLVTDASSYTGSPITLHILLREYLELFPDVNS